MMWCLSQSDRRTERTQTVSESLPKRIVSSLSTDGHLVRIARLQNRKMQGALLTRKTLLVVYHINSNMFCLKLICPLLLRSELKILLSHNFS